MSLVRASAILTECFTFLESKKHPGICDTQVLEIQFIPQNVLFLRWHYPDQVLGFKVNTLRLSRLHYQRPFLIVFVSLLLTEKKVNAYCIHAPLAPSLYPSMISFAAILPLLFK